MVLTDKEVNLVLSFILYIKINSNGITGLRIKYKTLKHSGKNTEKKNLWDPGLISKEFSDLAPKA